MPRNRLHRRYVAPFSLLEDRPVGPLGAVAVVRELFKQTFHCPKLGKAPFEVA